MYFYVTLAFSWLLAFLIYALIAAYEASVCTYHDPCHLWKGAAKSAALWSLAAPVWPVALVLWIVRNRMVDSTDPGW